MKTFVVFAMFALAIGSGGADISRPLELFEGAHEIQQKVDELVQQVLQQSANIRIATSTVLQTSSDAVLKEIDSNIKQIFELDEDVRKTLYDDKVENWACVRSLRVRLNAITEFTGFDSSVCLQRYDRNLTSTTTDIGALLQQSMADANLIQMLVPRSFVFDNVWTHPDDILSRLQKEYEEHRSRFLANSLEADDMMLNFSAGIEGLNGSLIDCFESLRLSLAPIYARFKWDLDTCMEFHTLPFFMPRRLEEPTGSF